MTYDRAGCLRLLRAVEHGIGAALLPDESPPPWQAGVSRECWGRMVELVEQLQTAPPEAMWGPTHRCPFRRDIRLLAALILTRRPGMSEPALVTATLQLLDSRALTAASLRDILWPSESELSVDEWADMMSGGKPTSRTSKSVVDQFLGTHRVGLDRLEDLASTPRARRRGGLGWLVSRTGYKRSYCREVRAQVNPVGVHNPNAVLTEGEVREARRLYNGGGHTYRDLAERFGVSKSTMYMAVTGKTWPTL